MAVEESLEQVQDSQPAGTRMNNLDVLRILGTYAVMLLYVSSKKIIGEQQSLLLVYDGLVRWAVPAFVMISGSIFLNESYPASISKMWKKVLRIALALYASSVLYCGFEHWRGADTHLVFSYAMKGYWHLWFLWMLMGLYIITPVLKRIAADERMLRYYLILAFVVAFAVPTVRYAVLPYVPLSQNEVVQNILNNLDTMNLHFLLGYTSLYLLGHYLSRKEFSVTGVLVCALLGVAGFAVNIGGNLYLTASRGQLIQAFNDAFRLNILAECVGLYVVTKFLFNRPGFRLPKFVRFLSDCCFGAYLVHLFYRELFDELFALNADTYRFTLWTPLLALLVFGVSILTSALLRLLLSLPKAALGKK